jgi:hypothetical protein
MWPGSASAGVLLEHAHVVFVGGTGGKVRNHREGEQVDVLAQHDIGADLVLFELAFVGRVPQINAQQFVLDILGEIEKPEFLDEAVIDLTRPIIILNDEIFGVDFPKHKVTLPPDLLGKIIGKPPAKINCKSITLDFPASKSVAKYARNTCFYGGQIRADKGLTGFAKGPILGRS